MRDVSVSRSLFGSAAAEFQAKESIEMNKLEQLYKNADRENIG
jgi:hypothetical protein